MTILRISTPPIDNPGGRRNFGRDFLTQPSPDCKMHILRLLRRGHFASSNRPHRLVRDHHSGPILHLLQFPPTKNFRVDIDLLFRSDSGLKHVSFVSERHTCSNHSENRLRSRRLRLMCNDIAMSMTGNYCSKTSTGVLFKYGAVLCYSDMHLVR